MELTPLQEDLEEWQLKRSLAMVQSMISRAIYFQDEFENRAGYGFGDREAVVVSGGCGVGAAIEELARVGHLMIEDWLKIRVKCIGIDLNPLPHLMPDEVLRINSVNGRVGEIQRDLSAEFRVDDLCRLETLDDGSVDILYVVEGFNAVVDVLGALEQCWRVLRAPDPERNIVGGVMAFTGAPPLLSKPDFQRVLYSTPGGWDTFNGWVTHPTGWFDDGYMDLWCARKEIDSKWNGKFPFSLIGQEPWPGSGTGAERHAVTGVYEYTGY